MEATNLINEDEALKLVEGLFKKESDGGLSKSLEKDVRKSVDRQRFASESLFLVKWQGCSYAHITWEPLSTIS